MWEEIYFLRVIDKWNGLSEHEVTAPSTSTFKKRYDKMENERQRINRSGIYEVRQSAGRTGLYIRWELCSNMYYFLILFYCNIMYVAYKDLIFFYVCSLIRDGHL